MLYIDKSYAQRILPSYKNYSLRNGEHNFACPFCGDSKRDKLKARGYVFESSESSGNLHYYCHNCGESMLFSTFLKRERPDTYKEYVLEKFTDKNRKESTTYKVEDTIDSWYPNWKDVCRDYKLQKVSSLPHNHHAKQYIESRCIPSSSHWMIYWSPRFFNLAHGLRPERYKDRGVEDESEMLVLPMLDPSGKYLWGMSGRAIPNHSTTSVRYISHMMSDRAPKIFGANMIDWEHNSELYVVEGQLDALCLPHNRAIAMAGSDAKHGLRALGEVVTLPKRIIYAYDNEPRNKQIVKRMTSTVEAGAEVVVWPPYIEEKDINDMLMSGLDVEKTIRRCADSGTSALLRIASWKKV